MRAVANLSFQANIKTFNGKSLMWFTGCRKGDGGSFRSVTLTFVSRIGPPGPWQPFQEPLTVQANPNKSNKGQFHGNRLRKWVALQQVGRKDRGGCSGVQGTYTAAAPREPHTHDLQSTGARLKIQLKCAGRELWPPPGTHTCSAM